MQAPRFFGPNTYAPTRSRWNRQATRYRHHTGDDWASRSLLDLQRLWRRLLKVLTGRHLGTLRELALNCRSLDHIGTLQSTVDDIHPCWILVGGAARRSVVYA
jgi:hypothetical protein